MDVECCHTIEVAHPGWLGDPSRRKTPTSGLVRTGGADHKHAFKVGVELGNDRLFGAIAILVHFNSQQALTCILTAMHGVELNGETMHKEDVRLRAWGVSIPLN
ncbi:MAG: hypothetical protein LBI39_01395 [Puniceicoccales bacterium]|jgi:hypothetical protein|nr:hypothetical protein [Puniceicoccales bacterium]